MSYFILSYILVLAMHSVHSQNETCDTSFTDLKHKNIDDSYCNAKTCIVKCCGENEVIHASKAGFDCKNLDIIKEIFLKRNVTVTNGLLDYNDLQIYKNDVYKSKVVSSKKFQEFTFLNSELFWNPDCYSDLPVTFMILEKGTMVYDNPNHYEYWYPISTRNFCVEKMVWSNKGKAKGKYILRYRKEDEKSLQFKTLFTAIGMVISAWFLLMVLAVYCLLPPLRNIQGLLLTAYVATLMCTYTLKGSYLFYSNSLETVTDCTVITQIIYYGILASFFWLKLMSFDIWWTFRGSRKRRAIHRRGITVKFLTYALYAYGVPALITIFAVIMDKKDLPPNIAKPFFASCFMTDTLLYYLYVPLMILTGCNFVLFLMTMYNIWLIKRNMASFDKTTVNKNKKNQNTFLLYIKLCSLMGVVWILEFIQIRIEDDDLPVSLYIVLNSYNIFIGPIIFFMFVCKRNIFLMLCKRFHIENRWTRAMYKVNSTVRLTHSKVSKDSKSYSRSYSRTRSTEDAEEALTSTTVNNTATHNVTEDT